MPSHGESLRAAFESRDLEQLLGLLDERVIWRGLPNDDHEHEEDGDARTHDAHDHDEHGHLPLCTDRDQVRAVFERFMLGGGTGQPVVLAAAGDSVVVDPRPEPPLPFPLHQGFTFRGDRVVLIQDYPDRASALADLGR
jgi:ketosteroid isomerase-like protein